MLIILNIIRERFLVKHVSPPKYQLPVLHHFFDSIDLIWFWFALAGLCITWSVRIQELIFAAVKDIYLSRSYPVHHVLIQLADTLGLSRHPKPLTNALHDDIKERACIQKKNRICTRWLPRSHFCAWPRLCQGTVVVDKSWVNTARFFCYYWMALVYLQHIYTYL